MSPVVGEERAARTGFDDVCRDVVRSGHVVIRSWPRSAGHLLLDLRRTSDGSQVAGQWFVDDEQAAAVARQTAASRSARAGSVGRRVQHLAGTGLVLQPDGADRRLPGLSGLLSLSGAELVSHRPERRAVVRHIAPGGGVLFSKAVRPSRVADLIRTASWSPPGVRVPVLRGIEPAVGVVSTAALPGRTLYDVHGDVSCSTQRLRDASTGTGAVVASLHRAAGPPGAARHGLAEEDAVTRRWLGHAAEHRTLGPAFLRDLYRLLTQMTDELGHDRAATATLHRDLHDKQVVVAPAPDRRLPALLDLDLCALGEPEIDVGNLAVHVLLMELQSGPQVSGAGGDATVEAVLQGYRSGAGCALDRGRLHRLAVVASIRLTAVHSYRPATGTIAAGSADTSAGLGVALLRRVHEVLG